MNFRGRKYKRGSNWSYPEVAELLQQWSDESVQLELEFPQKSTCFQPNSGRPARERHLSHWRPVQGEYQKDSTGVPPHQGQSQDDVRREVVEVL